MTSWQTLRAYTTAQYRVALQCQPDEDSDENEAYCFRVIVMRDDRIVGSDYLGDSVYDDPADFAREHLGIVAKARAELPPGAVYCVYFPDMLRSAIAMARRSI